MQDVDRVIALVESVSGDRAKVMVWLGRPLATFGGRAPLQLSADGRTDALSGCIIAVSFLPNPYIAMRRPCTNPASPVHPTVARRIT